MSFDFNFKRIATLGLLGISTLAVTAVPSVANAEPAHPLPAHSGDAFNAGGSKRPHGALRVKPNSSPLACGVQFSSWIPPNGTQNWFTYDWPASSYIEWSAMSDTTYGSGQQISLSNVATQRTDSNNVTYWLTIQNLTSYWQYFEGRYCFLG